MQHQLVKYLCDCFCKDQHLYSNIDQKVFRYLIDKRVSSSKEHFDVDFKEKNPVKRLSLWRDLLKTTLLSSLRESLGEGKEVLKEAWYALSAHNTLKEFQLEQAYTLLIAHLLNIPYLSKYEPVQLENGLTPIETASHWPCMNTPLLEWHAELGTLWVLLGKLLNKPSYTRAAQKLAKWQTKGLDIHFKPHKGFLSSHHLSHFTNALLREGVLFHAIALSSSDPQMAYLAKQHFCTLLETKKDDFEDFSLDALLLLSWIDVLFKEQLTPIEPKLEEIVQDPNLALVGYRSSALNILVSFLGVNMGFGSLKNHDLEIPAFGPQLELLGEGKLFGLIGQNPLNSSHKEHFQVDTDRNEFNVKGVVGLPKVEASQDYWKTWQTPSDWMECNIFFEENALNIHLTPYRVKSKLFFVFYAIAEKCLVGGEEKILPHSLNQYQGEAAPITLIGKQSVITLDSLDQKNQLKIIPLEGHRSFWGANYLIAYHLNNKYSTFKWKISTR